MTLASAIDATRRYGDEVALAGAVIGLLLPGGRHGPPAT
jgi:hypothetical protein